MDAAEQKNPSYVYLTTRSELDASASQGCSFCEFILSKVKESGSRIHMISASPPKPEVVRIRLNVSQADEGDTPVGLQKLRLEATVQGGQHPTSTSCSEFLLHAGSGRWSYRRCCIKHSRRHRRSSSHRRSRKARNPRCRLTSSHRQRSRVHLGLSAQSRMLQSHIEIQTDAAYSGHRLCGPDPPETGRYKSRDRLLYRSELLLGRSAASSNDHEESAVVLVRD